MLDTGCSPGNYMSRAFYLANIEALQDFLVPCAADKVDLPASNSAQRITQHLVLEVRHADQHTVLEVPTMYRVNQDQIRHLKLSLCPTCVLTKMKAFSIYRSLSHEKHGVFESISFDILEFGQRTRYVVLYVDKCNNKFMVYGMKQKSELLSTLKLLIYINMVQLVIVFLSS